MSFKSTVKSIAKWSAIVAVATPTLIAIGLRGHTAYYETKYNFTADDWYDYSSGNREEEDALVRVLFEDGYTTRLAYQDSGKVLGVTVYWSAVCKPNSKVATSEKYWNGDPMFLTCTEDGENLRMSAARHLKTPYQTFDLEGNFDGYGYEVSYWDYSQFSDEAKRFDTLKRLQ